MIKKILITTATCLGVTTTAFAVTAQSGVYVGGNLGWNFPTQATTSSVAQEVATDVGGGLMPSQVAVSKNNKNYMGGVTLGYQYALNSSILAGVEANYTYLGKTHYSITVPGDTADLDIKTETFQLLLTSEYLDQSGFNAFAKAGMAHVDEKHSATVGGQSVNLYGQGDGSRSKWLPALAVGVGYMPIQNLNIALQYEHIFGSTHTNATVDESKPYSQNVWTIGAQYTFPL